MNLYKRFLIIGIALFCFTSCLHGVKINPEKEKSSILKLLEAERKYHFEKMANELVSLQSDDFTSINRGEIIKPTKEEGVKKFSRYFSSVEFESWDDMVEPTIKFSDDYTVAYVTVKKKVVITYKNKEGVDTKESTDFAWVSIYRKVNSLWKMDLIASTNKEPSSK